MCENATWQNALKEVDQLRDKLGRGLDPEIRELVACLRMHGLHTVMSCGGHPGREPKGPYVMFQSSEAIALETEFWALAKAGERGTDDARKLRDSAYELNLKQRIVLSPLLGKFYKHRQTPTGSRIIITTFNLGGSRLQCQDAELYRFVPLDRRAEFLAPHQREFFDLTAFLKSKLGLPASIVLRETHHV